MADDHKHKPNWSDMSLLDSETASVPCRICGAELLYRLPADGDYFEVEGEAV